MSEKELRNKYAQHAGPCSFIMDFGHRPDLPRKECDCGLREALALNPDVVVVLEILQKAYDDAVIVDERSIYYSLILAVEHHFLVRLTGDGKWEYTDA